jgi:hypothetical protein
MLDETMGRQARATQRCCEVLVQHPNDMLRCSVILAKHVTEMQPVPLSALLISAQKANRDAQFTEQCLVSSRVSGHTC